jgi:hypothetical protein
VTGRRNRRFLWLICGILVLALAGSELPELLTLTNNTSNDFTTYLTSSNTAAALRIHAAILQQRISSVGLRRNYHGDSLLLIVDAATRGSPRDLLVLHSFWRT